MSLPCPPFAFNAARSARLIPTIRDIQRHGAPSLHSIADTLNTRGIPTARGKTWTAMQVSNVLARADVGA
jgi:hypothetical protein